MLRHFNTLTPVDMITRNTSDGELIPVRFKNSGGVSNILGFRLIQPKGEYTTPDGVYLSNQVRYYEVECTAGENRILRVFMYYDKDDPCWYVSIKPRS